MKKKDAIERLAKELESRDQRQFEDATKAAGAAATVTPIIKDYKALATTMLQRAATGIAFNRAMSELDRPSVLQEKAVSPNTIPRALHTHKFTGSCFVAPFHDTPTDKLQQTGVSLEQYIDQGWLPRYLQQHGYIRL